MPDRALTYDVKLNIAQARAEVNQLLRVFQSDLKNVELPALAPQLFDNAVAQTRVLSSEFRQLNTQAQQFAQSVQQAQVAQQRQAASAGPTGGGIGGALIGSLAGYLTIQGVQQLGQSAVNFSELGTQVRRSGEAFSILSGSADIAQRRIEAIKQASGGTIDSMKAIEIGTQATALGLAKTTDEFEKLTRAGRAIALVSPVIHDVGEALTQLSLFAANEQSFQRADQLGLSVSEVKDRMAELRAENENLSGSDAKLQASIEILNEKFGGVLDSGSAAASGLEKFRVALAEARNEAAKGPIGQAVDQLFGGFAGLTTDLTTNFGGGGLNEIQSSIQRLAQTSAAGAFLPWEKEAAQRLDEAAKAIDKYNEAISKGVPGAQEFQQQAEEIARAILYQKSATEEQIAAFATLTASGRTFTEDFSGATSGNITAAIEQRNQQIEEAKNLAQSLSEIDQLLATTGEFTPAQLPGIDQLQQALISLKSEIATTGQVTEEQRATIARLEDVLSRASSGVQFLSTAEGQAAIATGGFNAALATTPGYLDAITVAAGQTAAALDVAIGAQNRLQNSLTSSLSGLISQGIITAQQAQQLYGQQQGQIGGLAYGVGQAGTPQEQAFAQAQAQYQLLEPVRALEQAERDRKAAAAEAERAWKKAATDTGAAFKQAAKQLEGDLRSVPGLFGATDVTQGQLDLAAGGVPQNFADNFLRRLRDEVQNGKDWEGVSIDMAREALQRVGIVASDNAETVVQQITDAWNNSTLFADPANLALIDQEAVQASLDLKEKARQGQQNILEHFGAVVDEAVAAVTGGGGGGYTPPPPAALPPALPPSLAQTFIGPLPQQLGQFQQTGGTLNAPFTVPVQVSDTAAADVTTQLIEQITAESERVEAIGALYGYHIKAGISAYSYEGIGSDIVASVAADLATQGEIIQGQGTNYATIVGLGITSFDYTEAAGGIVSGIAGKLAAQGETILGQGSDYAGIVGLGLAGYDFTTATKSAMIGIRNGFGTQENLDMAIGTGSAIMQFIIDGMGGKANEDGALDGLVSALFQKLLEAIQGGVG